MYLEQRRADDGRRAVLGAPWEPEAVGTLDVLATLYEALAIACIGMALRVGITPVSARSFLRTARPCVLVAALTLTPAAGLGH